MEMWDIGTHLYRYSLIHPLQGRIWQFLVKSCMCISYDFTLPSLSIHSQKSLIQTQKGTNTQVMFKALLRLWED